MTIETIEQIEQVLVPFYRGAVVFQTIQKQPKLYLLVLVPFYRGAVVFPKRNFTVTKINKCSRPLLSRSGCIYGTGMYCVEIEKLFSSPFIEERLYLISEKMIEGKRDAVLVPFYRGAVVFN